MQRSQGDTPDILLAHLGGEWCLQAEVLHKEGGMSLWDKMQTLTQHTGTRRGLQVDLRG